MPPPVANWPKRVAVVGAGAVGSYFGGMLARAGFSAVLIGRPAHTEAIRRDGLLMESIHFRERVCAEVSTDLAAVRGADFVLFCVKTRDNEQVARLLAPHLMPDATVLSLQNGVDNVERIRAASGIEALPAVVYIAASLPAPGSVKHAGRGDLVVGLLPWQQDGLRAEQLQRISQLFPKAAVPCRVSENIEGELWAKLVVNCAGNAVTALGQASYRRAAHLALARQVMLDAALEAIAVARAAGVVLPAGDLLAAGLKLAEQLGEATSSTTQDLQRGRPTEIDSLNGYVVRRGQELGVPTPVNQTLYALVKLLEDSLAGRCPR